MKYKEMKYQRARTIEVLAKGNFHDYDWYVLSLGTHPTAYVDVGDKLYKEFEKYDTCDIPIECHGGVTYRKDTLNLESSMEIGNFIGWDYTHAGDYSGCYGNDPILGKYKKWTTEEIVEEVEEVCGQLWIRENGFLAEEDVLKAKFDDLLECLKTIHKYSRELSLAITKLEEAQMWYERNFQNDKRGK